MATCAPPRRAPLQPQAASTSLLTLPPPPIAPAAQVCELDIIFNFHKAYYIVDELFIGGHLSEPSKKEVLRVCAAQDDLMDEAREKGKR